MNTPIRAATLALWFLVVPSLGEDNRCGAVEPGKPDYVVRVWQTDDGLPDNSVRCMAQTHDGYLWVGTFDGLARFDSTEFALFTLANVPELRAHQINVLYEDTNGTLWIGTETGGLSYYRHGRFGTVPREHGLTSDTVYRLAEDENGTLWICTSTGLFRKDGDTFTEIDLPNEFWRGLTGVLPVGDGRLWLSGDNGLMLMHNDTFTVHPACTNGVTAMALDANGVLWCWVKRIGLLEIGNGHTAHHPEVPGTWVNAILISRDGAVWLADRACGLIRFQGGHAVAYDTADGLAVGGIASLIEDREGNLWVGSNGGGLHRFRPKSLRVYSTRNGLSNNDVVSVCEGSEGRIWIGTLGGGLNLLQAGHLSNYTWPKCENVVSLCKSEDGGLWVGTHGYGLTLFHEGRLTRDDSPAGPIVRVVYRDHRDRLWVGSGKDGLHCLNEGCWTSYTTADGLAHRTVTCLLEDRLGQMWIGTPHGLNRLADGRFTRFGRADGLVVETIQSLFEDSTGNLWVGTSGGGIARYRNERFSPVTTRHGLADNVISQILEDDHGCLWLGSNRGLMRVPLQDLLNCADGRTNAVHCIEYGRDQGLLKAEFTGGFQPNCMKTSDGKLWFCTVGGLVVVDPANVISNSVVPPVHIQRVIVDGQSVGSPHSNEPAAPGNNANGVRTDRFGRVIVPAGARRLEFHYAALSFTAPERVRFRYKLEGWDKEWVEAGTVRAASYTRVSPGSYRFRMTACNEDGLWNQTGATLAVTILPAWWQTTWFRTSLLFVLCGLLFSLHEWRIRLLKQRRLAQELLSCRLISSQEEERKRLARELHDGLGQHLLVIKNLAAMGARSGAEHQSGAEQFETISKLASQVIGEVRQITRALRPFELDRLGLTKAIVWLIRPAAESSGIQFDIDVDDLSGAFQRDSEINFYRIVQESIANILKHSKATRACVRIKRDPAQVHVCIRDNGCGFNSSEAPSVGGTGLVSIAERVRILGGRLRVESAPAAGTVLWIEIPVQKSLYGQATNPD